MAFRLEEATIDDLHAAIKAGEITCVQVVQHYLDRARAYNGAYEAASRRRIPPPAFGPLPRRS
jgi:Asp-tRNA(Asn)/Glu-tRNA(Gln) amidotransferase A subunit family amidase